MTAGLLQRMAVPLLHLFGPLQFDNTNFLRGQSKVRSEGVLLIICVYFATLADQVGFAGLLAGLPVSKQGSHDFGQLRLVACCVSQSTDSFCAGQDESSSEAKTGDNDAVSTVISRGRSADLPIEADVSPVTTVICPPVSQAILQLAL